MSELERSRTEPKLLLEPICRLEESETKPKPQVETMDRTEERKNSESKRGTIVWDGDMTENNNPNRSEYLDLDLDEDRSHSQYLDLDEPMDLVEFLGEKDSLGRDLKKAGI